MKFIQPDKYRPVAHIAMRPQMIGDCRMKTLPPVVLFLLWELLKGIHCKFRHDSSKEISLILNSIYSLRLQLQSTTM